MKLIFEKSVHGKSNQVLPPNDVDYYELKDNHKRSLALRLPELTESELARHYTALEGNAFGVSSGYYPLGSCTMKHNPKINEETAALPGFASIHPLQPSHTVQGCLEAFKLIEKLLCEVTGMDNMSFQPAAGAHGEFAGLLLIKKYHVTRGDTKRVKMIVPDTAHGTNPASANMAGFKIVAIKSCENGFVDLATLKAAVGDDTAGLMLTNPSTLGLFEAEILEIAKVVHDAGGLLYYDGANLNPIMGIVRPGDMGFDVIHLNLHKSFSTPHGGGGPGSGPVGCKSFLSEFLPVPKIVGNEGELEFSYEFADSIGCLKAFYGNFLVVIRALTYILTLGSEGIPETAKHCVLNANYMMKKLDDLYEIAFPGMCMHEFVITAEKIKKETGVSAKDIAKGIIDNGMHPPTMYFPINVHEALMIEPTETESMSTIDEAVKVYRKIYEIAHKDPQSLLDAPVNAQVRRLDEVMAARNPILRFSFD
ncbi:MAG: aminomethyl-transferring glycine dehydrogenase subunit GcvPB [Synergistaceae bacterium]|nr:aminomethyl-transferring glycine dehydrogenase subunit GcvPB [Synergistaceae bacterium]